MQVDTNTLAVSQLVAPTAPLETPRGLYFLEPYLYSINARYLLKTEVYTGLSKVVATSPLFNEPQGLAFHKVTPFWGFCLFWCFVDHCLGLFWAHSRFFGVLMNTVHVDCGLGTKSFVPCIE